MKLKKTNSQIDDEEADINPLEKVLFDPDNSDLLQH